MLIKNFFYGAARHLWKLYSDPYYRTWCWLESRFRKVPRCFEFETKVHGLSVQVLDAASFLSAYREIFVSRIYEFRWHNSQPRILDLGANIGVSILYFKKIFPDSKITAFEADPSIFQLLRKNIHGNGFEDVELVNKAVWTSNGKLRFRADGADGGAIVDTGNNLIEVDAIDVREILKTQQFDFIKIDIEGAENEVFLNLTGLLKGVRYIFLEYHSSVAMKQKLGDILRLLADEGFRVNIHSILPYISPFVLEQRGGSDFDLQLNIFAVRKEK